MAPRGRVPVVMDVDTGVDDAFAMLLALRCPLIEVLAVTCVHGNVNVDIVVSNTLSVLDAAEAPTTLPVARGFAEPLVSPVQHCPEIHGEDGLADLNPPLPPSTRKPWEGHAVQLLLDTLRSAPSRVTVIALAPLTNIAVAIRTDPALWRSKLERLVWMGGAVARGGNATSWGEANARYDPEAAHIVLTSGLPIFMYPWDVFLNVEYTRKELSGLGVADVDGGDEELDGKRRPWSILASRLLYRMMQRFGSDGGLIGDAGAVAAAFLPDAITVKDLHVAVELTGTFTRGMTACDLRGVVHPPDDPKQAPNVSVVMDLDPAAIKSFFNKYVLTSDAVDNGLSRSEAAGARSRSRSRGKSKE